MFAKEAYANAKRSLIVRSKNWEIIAEFFGQWGKKATIRPLLIGDEKRERKIENIHIERVLIT